MMLVVNGQSSEAHEMNAGIRQGPLFDPTFIVIYISHLNKNTLRPLVTIFDTTVYGLYLQISK